MKIIKTKANSDYQNDLSNIIEHDLHLYNTNNYTFLYKYFLEEQNGNYGVIKAFIYSNSVRFKLLFNNAPQHEDFQVLANLINQTCEEKNINKVMLWYSQKHDKLCDNFLKLLPTTGDFYWFSEYAMPRNTIKREVDLRGLSNKLYSVEMLDDCINILESAFTPILDTPGAFINDKDWINKLFQLTDKSRCEVFFHGDNAVGLYSHNDGCIEYVAVKKEYQNFGFGSVILTKAFYEILNGSINSPSLCSGDKNVRAQRFYERAGMKKICSTVRIEILHGIFAIK